jgi:hypothetical protein
MPVLNDSRRLALIGRLVLSGFFNAKHGRNLFKIRLRFPHLLAKLIVPLNFGPCCPFSDFENAPD